LGELIRASTQYQPRLNKGIIVKRLSARELIKEDACFTPLLPQYTASAEQMDHFFLEEIKLLE